ncbi:MAG: hypothetical protein ABIX28_14465 [Vicinamibacterales bacterium]
MTLLRATTYAGVALLLATWLASASGVSAPPDSAAPQSRPAVSATQALADDVQAQTARLRGRLASAPAPRTPARNPFTFAPRADRPVAGSARPAPMIDAAAALPPEPPLQLVGVAEQETAGTVVRTAMITADSDELFMLTVGGSLGGRYRVTAIAPEAVELSDLVTGGTRRLTLR